MTRLLLLLLSHIPGPVTIQKDASLLKVSGDLAPEKHPASMYVSTASSAAAITTYVYRGNETFYFLFGSHRTWASYFRAC